MGSEENSEGRCGRDEDADEDDGFAETLEDDAEAEDEEYDEGDDDGVRSSKRRRRGSQTRRNGRGRDSGGTVRYEVSCSTLRVHTAVVRVRNAYSSLRPSRLGNP